MEQWYLYKKKADFNQIGEKFNIDPVIARLIRNRDVVGDEQIQQYLYGELSDISDPFLMKGVKEGVEILKQKVQEGKTIRIISDYDVDGVVSNYILWKAIHDLGGKIDFQIPDRMKDGYGINENIIEKAVEDQIDTILTCDNGIAAADAVAYGKEHGLTMIITDHHDVPFDTDEAGVRKEVLPPADVVINPKQEACNYPYPLLCGAGVAFQFMRAFYQAMEEDESQLEELLSMLAIATVCDVVDLTGENRIFVKEGLRRIKDTQNIGLKALLNVHDLMDKQIQSYALGFIVGPCINASGRLESAEKALNLFLEEDEEKAYEKLADEFGIDPVRLIWRPKGMKFEKMILDTDIQVAEVDYLYKSKRIEYFISASYGEVSWGYDNEDKKINCYYEQVGKADIEVTEYETPETERNRYVAEFEYKKMHYCFSGEMKKEEIENILKNLYFY